MPDITMCDDKSCPQRKRCYRYTAKPSDLRQSWFAEKVRGTEVCHYFSSNEQRYDNSNTRKT